MYKNYIFDLYGTLIDINTNEWEIDVWIKMQEFYGFYGLKYTAKELKKHFDDLVEQEENKLVQYDYPEIKIENIFRMIFQENGIDIDIETCEVAAKFFRIMSTQYIKLYDGVIELMELLKAKNKKIYLLSNAQQIFTEDEMKYVDIYKYFDGVIFSSDQQCKKPSKQFFNSILDKFDLRPDESIMIGNDWKTDIEGAVGAGIDSLYIHTNISPIDTIFNEIKAKYKVLDGDFKSIKNLIIK